MSHIASSLCSVILMAAAATPLVAGSNAPPNGQVNSSVKDLMQSFIDPSADVIWNAVGTVVDKEHGIQELAPRTDEEWQEVRRAAVRIIEGGNLLMMPGRQAAPPGAKSETPGVELEPAEITALITGNRRTFDTFARELQALGVQALRATEAKNAPLLQDIGAQMENVCEGCHQTFWYPPKPPQPGRR